ncbi:MAG: DUF4392 domain-containing protein [Planctomycetaceae bacterium]
MAHDILSELERIIRTDPARRGLISRETVLGPLLPGHLGRAAHELADHATSVAIVTGFFIPGATPPAAETDGPLGAVFLAEALRRLGIETVVLTDALCRSAVQAAAESLPFPAELIHSVPATEESLGEIWQPSRYSHLIALERVGPNHTSESIRLQSGGDPTISKQFENLVKEEERGRCFNMRGICIDEWTPPLHRLFEQAQSSASSIVTIGIGDGGNEIGMGSIPWSELARRLPEPQGGKIACRVACDWTILAGVSNWGGYALAAAVAHLRGQVQILEPWTGTQQWEWLQAVVRNGPAVDGVTRLHEPTVDGLPFATYIQPWDAMRQLLGLRR